ncbi:MAG: hypothetical protein ACRC0X_04630 [Brevinema sp.]
MKLFLLLASCLFLSLHQVNNFNVRRNNTFLDKVVLQYFSYQNTYIQFIKNGNTIIVKQDFLPLNATIKEFELHAIYTPSKAVYTLDNYYVGVVIIDSSLYTTNMETNILALDFSKLTLKGIKEKYIF